MPTLLAAALALALLAPGSVQENRAEVVRARFVVAHAAGNAETVRELWRENEDLVLVTVDADLEAGLAAWEAAREDPPVAGIEELFARARWGAELGSEVTGRPIFAEYAAAFSGWNDAQREAFRAGQAAHREARRMLKDEDHEGALAAARACRDRALPLGDWWGAAMGYAAEGEALRHLGRRAEATAALAQARLIYHDLALRGSELRCLEALVEELVRLREYRRALPAAEACAALAGAVSGEEAAERARRHVDQCRRALELLESDG